MKINYDPQANALYIKLKDAEIDESDEISDGMIVDYDKDNNPIGIEILDADKFLGGEREMKIELAITDSLKK